MKGTYLSEYKTITPLPALFLHLCFSRLIDLRQHKHFSQSVLLVINTHSRNLTMTCSRMRDEPPAYEETTGSSSTAIPGDNKTQLQDEDTRSKYGLISFSGYDRVRLMRFPESIVALVSETLQRHWPKGIQKVKAYYESTEFKLRGNPFEHGDDDEKVALRNAILGLLDALAREGWGVHPAAGGLGRIGNYKSLGQKGMFLFIIY